MSSSFRNTDIGRRTIDLDQEAGNGADHGARRVAERMRAVAAAASGVIGARSREELRRILEDACRQVVPFDAFFVQGYEAETHTFHGFGGRDAGLISPQSIVTAASTPGERVVHERRSLLTLSSDDPAAQGGHLTGTGRRSESVIRSPILSGDDVLGILSVHSYTPESYTEEDVQVIETIASLAAIALENLRLSDERAGSEKALRERERQLWEAQRIAQLGSWRWTIGSDRVQWSDEMFHIYGLSPGGGDIEFARFVERIHPDDRSMLMERIGEARRTGEPYELLHRIIRPDGEERILLARGDVSCDADGAVQEMFGTGQDVTDRKAAETELQRAHDELEERIAARTAELAQRTAELERAEQRFRAIVEASPTPLLLSSVENGTILYANDRLEALLGAPPGSLGGKKTPDFYFEPADRPKVIETVRKHGFVRDHELRIKRYDGTPRWVSLTIQRLDYDGVPAVATALIDMTERKQTEQALRASEESYRGLFDNLTELVYVQDLDGRFLNVNDAVVRAYGYAREEIVGGEPDLLAAPDLVDIEETLRYFRRAAAGEPQRFEWWGRRKDGSVFPKEVALKRSTYFGQDVVIAVARDISERVEAEAALRRSEQHFRRLIENASDLISIIDAEGTIQYESPAVTRILGYDAAEMVGRNAFDFFAPEDVAPTKRRLAELVEHPDTPVFAEFRFRHKDGSWRFIEAVGMPLNPESPADGVIVNSRDITERKRAESTLRLQKTLLEAQGEASIDGILVVSEEGKIVSFNQRFVELWNIPADVIASRSDEAAIQTVLDQLVDPEAFQERIIHLYDHPYEKARDEVVLRDGRVFDRYSGPVMSSEGDYYGRIWFFRDMTARKRHEEELEQARREAEGARVRASRYAKTLERELEFGRKIQQGLLPAALPEASGWEIAVRFRPVWQVAGDFYDAFELPSGHIGLIIADVSGKGVGAALFMALFQSLLRASAERAGQPNEGGAADDAAILSEAVGATNSYITRVHRHAHMFASVFFGLLDPATGELCYVNAGHERPAVIEAGGALRRLETTGPALGLLSDTAFAAQRTVLEPGELLVAFTDGVTEARSSNRDFFTEERLLALLNAPVSSAVNLLDRIERAVCDFAGEAAPSDDLTLLAVRRSGNT